MLPVLDFSTVKDEVFPPIATVFSKTGSLNIKIRGLEAFVILCGGTIQSLGSTDDFSGMTAEPRPLGSSTSSILDKFTIQEKIVPLIKAIKTKEPAVMMAALNVFKQIGQIVDTEFLALEVLPIMWTFSLGPLLNVQQFRSYVDLIKTLSSRIETEWAKKLQELSSTGNGHQSKDSMPSPLGMPTNNINSDGSGVQELDFERLVLGKDQAAGSSSISLDHWGAVSSPSAGSAGPPRPDVGPKFSWSSASTIPNTRSITPDTRVSSFPVLQPSSGLQSTNQLSAISPSFSSTRPAPNPQPSLSQFSMNTSPLNPPVTNTHSIYQANTQQAPATLPFMIPPPPASNFQFSRQTTTSMPPPPLGTTNSISQASARLPLQSQVSLKPGGQQGQGLDKYESLL